MGEDTSQLQTPSPPPPPPQNSTHGSPQTQKQAPPLHALKRVVWGYSGQLPAPSPLSLSYPPRAAQAHQPSPLGIQKISVEKYTSII